MDKSMIREAANKIRECVDFSWHNIGNSAKLEEARKLLDTILAELDKPGEGDPDAHLSDEDYLKAKQDRFAKGGLANVDPDKYMEEVRGTGKVLTDEEIERIAKDLEDILCENEGVVRSSSWLYRDGAKDALRYARDNFILSAPAKAPAELLRAGWMVDGAVNNEGFARLTFTKPENEPTAVEVEVYAALKSNTPEHGN